MTPFVTSTLRIFHENPSAVTAGADLLLVTCPIDTGNRPTVDTPNRSSSANTDKITGRALANSAYLAPNALVIPVQKSDRNPFADSITIGRARNNDLVIEHAQVSKVHAYAMFIAGDRTSIMLKDGNSMNGTWVFLGSGMRRLAKGESVLIHVGMELRIGVVDAMLVDQDGLLQAVTYAAKNWKPEDL